MNRISKEAAEYTDTAAGEKTCGTCAMFHATDHRCDLVRGVISAAGWCKHWTKKEPK